MSLHLQFRVANSGSAVRQQRDLYRWNIEFIKLSNYRFQSQSEAGLMMVAGRGVVFPIRQISGLQEVRAAL